MFCWRRRGYWRPPGPLLMTQWLDNYQHTRFENVFEQAAATHLQFERIHPFADGNGRTGRLLINLTLLGADVPAVVIPKASRSDYFELLANQDRAGLTKMIASLSVSEGERMKKFDR